MVPIMPGGGILALQMKKSGTSKRWFKNAFDFGATGVTGQILRNMFMKPIGSSSIAARHGLTFNGNHGIPSNRLLRRPLSGTRYFMRVARARICGNLRKDKLKAMVNQNMALIWSVKFLTEITG
jgi:hypothetical protein